MSDDAPTTTTDEPYAVCTCCIDPGLTHGTDTDNEGNCVHCGEPALLVTAATNMVVDRMLTQVHDDVSSDQRDDDDDTPIGLALNDVQNAIDSVQVMLVNHDVRPTGDVLASLVRDVLRRQYDIEQDKTVTEDALVGANLDALVELGLVVVSQSRPGMATRYTLDVAAIVELAKAVKPAPAEPAGGIDLDRIRLDPRMTLAEAAAGKASQEKPRPLQEAIAKMEEYSRKRRAREAAIGKLDVALATAATYLERHEMGGFEASMNEASSHAPEAGSASTVALLRLLGAKLLARSEGE